MNVACPKTGEPCPAKVLAGELEVGELRDGNVDVSPNDVPTGRRAAQLAETIRQLLIEGVCSVGSNFEIVIGVDSDDDDYSQPGFSLDSCTNSNVEEIKKIENKLDIVLTSIHTDLPSTGEVPVVLK